LTLEALGNLGDFVGGIGVVASLLYLAQQIRRNTASVQAAAIQTTAQGAGNILAWLASDEDLMRLFVEGCHDFDALSKADRHRFGAVMGVLLLNQSNVLSQTRMGFLAEDFWQGGLHRLRGTFALPGTVAWWQRGGRNSFNPQLQAWVDVELIGRSPS
jgi:hypothetical protein